MTAGDGRLLVDALAEQRVVPVIRAPDADAALATARACADAGMRVVELTLTTPGVDRAVRALAGDGLLVGVGTVTHADQVRQMAAAGARFVVSFALPQDFVAEARRVGIPAIPGAFTPSEVLRARIAGATAVKLFPARALPTAMVGDLRAVMPDLHLMATGGVSADDSSAQAWLAAGATAVGLGRDLGTAGRDGAAEVTRRAAAALAATRAAA